MSIDIIVNRLNRLDCKINYQGSSYAAVSTEFRSGDNPLGLRCYENNCWDETAQKYYTWPQFISLYKKISIKDAEKWLKGIEVDDGNFDGAEKEEKMRIPTYLKEADYKDLVKSYDFFLKRGISKETLDTYGAGLAQSGLFFGRICFPIRIDGVLRGMTGRMALQRENASKWIIKGPKKEFVYPLFEQEVFQKTKQICIVESVGDSLSLWNSGIKQNLVQFGLHISPKLLSFIIAENPQKIFVSLNNDDSGDQNRGQNAAKKTIEKLLMFFSSDKIVNAPPIKNDFGDQSHEENIEWANKYGVKIN